MDAKAKIPLNMRMIMAKRFNASESMKKATILAIIAIIGRIIGR
jgi:hypothetical protein